MKVSLFVLSTGKAEGKAIPITLSQFLIGRDPQCHLRPASEVISKRHCAILMRNNKVFVRDLDSTNGTFVNDEPVKGEVEIKHQDRLKVGPLAFEVRIEASPVSSKPTPIPPATKKPAQQPVDDESIAAMLLGLHDDGSPGSSAPERIPDGSTLMEIPTPLDETAEKKTDGGDKEAKPKQTPGNTSHAAKALLEKYMRRPRG